MPYIIIPLRYMPYTLVPFYYLASCGTPSSLSNGVRHYDGTTVGSTVSYTCYAGYIRSAGNSSRTCQSNGLWSGSHPTCTSELLQNVSDQLMLLAHIYGVCFTPIYNNIIISRVLWHAKLLVKWSETLCWYHSWEYSHLHL